MASDVKYDSFTDVVVPVGTILPFATTTLPVNFLECNGVSLLVGDYPALHALIQFNYGGSGGSFNLPDYQNYFVRGFDKTGVSDPNYTTRTSRGDGTGGAVIGSKQSHAYANHYHNYYYSFSTGSGYSTSRLIRAQKDSSGTYVSGTLNAQSGGLSETRPNNVRVVYAMRVY